MNIQDWKKVWGGSDTPKELQGLPHFESELPPKAVAPHACLGGYAHIFEKWPPDEDGFEYRCHICQCWLDPNAPSEDELRERREEALHLREIPRSSPRVNAGRGWGNRVKSFFGG